VIFMGPVVGTVRALRRYPVKSLLGEDVPAGDVTERGLAGDRCLALVHRETGKIASAKDPRVWRALLTLTAETLGPAVRITAPGGASVWSTDADADAVLSGLLGRPVTLIGTPPPGATLDRAVPEEVLRDGVDVRVPVEVSGLGAGTFFDFAPIHLLTTSTLDRIAEASPRNAIEAERYRPNLVIRTSAGGYAENEWVGRELRIGDELVVRVVVPTPRCAVPTLEHGVLPRDTAALRVLARHNRLVPREDLGPQPCAGVYAQVVRPGRIGVGDEVRLT
jgi:MOSC domain-containing protein